MRDPRTKTGQRSRIDFSQIEKLHPYKTFLFFALLGSSIVFMTITFLYLREVSSTLATRPASLPKPFFVSSLILLFSSFTASRIRPAFQQDSFSSYFVYTGLTLAMGLLFIACQLLGWNALVGEGGLLGPDNRYSFFYVISGMHFLHVVGGVVFLLVLFIHGYLQSRDPVKSLLFFSNTYFLTRIELAAIFWHFVDFLWIGLFLIFLFTF